MSRIIVDSLRGNSASSDAISLANDGTCTANITNNLSNRNVVINGAMQVAQRGTSQTGVNSSGYKTVCDRWRFNASGSNVGTYTVSQSTTTPDGFGNSLKIDCTTARTPSNDEMYEVEQRFEGQNLQAFAKGTSAAKKFSVSFYVKTNVSGNYVVWLYDADNNRNIGAVYTVSDSNWNRYTVSFPADTTGAFGNDNARSLDLRFVLLAGTDFTSGTLPTTAWESTSNANSRAGQTANVASNTSNEWYLTGVQLEVSDHATDFEHRTFAQELELCKRYFFQIGRDARNNHTQRLAFPFINEAPSNTGGYINFRFYPEMRAAPTATIGSELELGKPQVDMGSYHVSSFNNMTPCGCYFFQWSGGQTGSTGDSNMYLRVGNVENSYAYFSAEL